MIVLVATDGHTAFCTLHLVLVEPLRLCHLQKVSFVVGLISADPGFVGCRVGWQDHLFGDADEDLAVLDLALLALQRKPVRDAACLAVRAVELEKCAPDAAIADEVVAAPDGELDEVLRRSLQVEDEAFGPLGFHASGTLRLTHDGVQDDCTCRPSLALRGGFRTLRRIWLRALRLHPQRLQTHLAVYGHLVKEARHVDLQLRFKHGHGQDRGGRPSFGRFVSLRLLLVVNFVLLTGRRRLLGNLVELEQLRALSLDAVLVPNLLLVLRRLQQMLHVGVGLVVLLLRRR